MAPRIIALLLAAALLPACATWRQRSPAPAPSGAPGRDPLDRWDPEVLALFLQAELLIQTPGSGADEARQATEVLQRAIARQPGDSALWRYLSAAWMEASDLEQAVTASSRAVEIQPDDAAAQLLLGEQLQRLGRPADAEPHLRVAEENAASAGDPHLAFYYHYAVLKQLRRVEEALSVLDRWEEALPSDQNPSALRARILWEEGRQAEAASAAVEALRRQPQDQELVRMILSYDRLDPLDAAEALESVVAARWSVAALHRHLVALYSDIGQLDKALDHLRYVEVLERSGGLDLLLERAALLLRAHRPEEVLTLLADRVPELAVLPQEVQIVLRLAEAHRQLGQLEAALALLQRVRVPSEGGVQAARLAAQILSAADRPEDALAWLARLEAELDPKAVESQGRVLEAELPVQLGMRRWVAAGSTVQRMGAIAPRRAVFAAADLARARGDLGEALSAVAAAQELAVDDLSLAALHADLLAASGRSDEAVAVLVRAERRRQDRLSSRLALAAPAQVARLRQDHRADLIFLLLRRSTLGQGVGNLPAAEAPLRRVLEFQPRNADALNGLAYLLAELGPDDRLVEAEDLSREALVQRPYSGAFLDTLGVILVRSDRLQEGLAALERADRYLPRNPEIEAHLAEALEASGDLARAQRLYEAALDGLRPGASGPLRARVEARLDVLRAATSIVP